MLCVTFRGAHGRRLAVSIATQALMAGVLVYYDLASTMHTT